MDFSPFKLLFLWEGSKESLIQMRLEAFEEDLSLDEVIQTQILNA